MLYGNSRSQRPLDRPVLQVPPVQVSNRPVPSHPAGRSSPVYPMLFGLGERLAISLVLTGVTFFGVAWALA